MNQRWSLGAAVFAALWIGCALLFALIAATTGPFAQVLAMLPRVPGVFHGWPIAWAVAAAAIVTVLVALSYATVGRLLSKDAVPTFAVGWLAAILAAAVVGIALDLPNVVRGVGMFGIRGLISEPFNLREAVLWALLAGWIPALIVSRRRAEQREGRRMLPAPVLLAATAAVALAFVVTGVAGIEAANAQAAQAAHDQAVAEQDAVGALPDPEASGDPVPSHADAGDPVPPGACTPENAILLLGTADAATGHRSQTIQLMNFSDQPCTIEGYPDIAFGDQNAHALAVTVEHGRSFMAEDLGPVRVEVPAHGTATSTIGWDANSTHGALVAQTLHAAIRAGEERGSWPVSLDIIEGSTVAVTAWRESTTSPE